MTRFVICPRRRAGLAALAVAFAVSFFATISALPAAAAPLLQEVQATKPADTQDPEEEKEKSDKERRDLTRRKARGERDLVMARERLRKAKLSVDLSQRAHDESQAKGRDELSLLARKLKTWMEKQKPDRLDRAQLSLDQHQDGAKEAQEELTQLEMMYREDQFADKTKEIVLERGRRRLERSRKALELETKSIELLRAEQLPVEQLEQEMAIKDKQQTLDRAQRDFDSSMIDLKLGVMSAEAEITRLEDEIDDATREITSFERKQKKKQAEAASKAASAPASAPKP